MKKECVLGIDTSNYKTSISLVDKKGNILKDERILLDVKGNGLRQSDAFFQHINNLPKLLSNIKDYKISCIAVSNKPRNLENSYMPCFKAGVNIGEILSNTLGVPIYYFSHQEGHIEVIKNFSDIKNKENFYAWHLSGGTSELLKIENNKISIIGGTKDISIGQLFDRIGFYMGYDFPSGPKIDNIGYNYLHNYKYVNNIPVIKKKGLYFNISGHENNVKYAIDKGIEKEDLIIELFEKISEIIIKMTYECNQYDDIIMIGGVSASKLIRYFINKKNQVNSNKNIYFGNPLFSEDNAIGIALLGRKNLWR